LGMKMGKWKLGRIKINCLAFILFGVDQTRKNLKFESKLIY
jgi:hypothetical protein